ncbi:helix-turn-helix domain-containing protein [Frankia casuarinae]|jgi:transcriptional regulator with XRE-family HTH domain
MPDIMPGDRIAQIRRRRSLSQEELAARSGVSVAVIRKLEQNRRAGARIETLHALARGLNVKTSELFDNGESVARVTRKVCLCR